MKNDKKIKSKTGTKVCNTCGRELPLSKFCKKECRCRECKNEYYRNLRHEKRLRNGIEQYLSDESMYIHWKYKKINRDRILRKKVSGIDFCAKDERFVRLLYYKDTWISNYGRCIVCENNKYKLLRGGIDKWTGERVYTLRKERYIKTTQYFHSQFDLTLIIRAAYLVSSSIWHFFTSKRFFCILLYYLIFEITS